MLWRFRVIANALPTSLEEGFRDESDEDVEPAVRSR